MAPNQDNVSEYSNMSIHAWAVVSVSYHYKYSNMHFVLVHHRFSINITWFLSWCSWKYILLQHFGLTIFEGVLALTTWDISSKINLVSNVTFNNIWQIFWNANSMFVFLEKNFAKTYQKDQKEEQTKKTNLVSKLICLN